MANTTPPRHITALPREVVERIAAGEVIERPASVVRELIENALDAEATAIRVEVRDGGLRLIRVGDDGCGILPEELADACQPHTTSKVHTLADLEHITTLGFRGEALASIAAVAELEIASASNDAGLAHSITLPSPRDSRPVIVPRTRGTTMTVRNLFQSVPARRALLGTAKSEAARTLSLVRRYVLAHPDRAFSLVADGHLLLQTHGNGQAAAIADAYGADVAHMMLPFGAMHIAGSELHGMVSARNISQPTREHVLVVVNGRPCFNRGLLAAIEAGYRPLLRKGRHPIVVVSIVIAPDYIDTNVHPAKAEVLLREEATLATALREAVHAALGNAPASVAAQTQRPMAPHLARPIQLQLGAPRKRRGLLLGEGRKHYDARPRPEEESEAADRPLQLEALCQFEDTLILARSDSGHLYLVDQHRAHERILYEQLRRQPAGPRQTSRSTDEGDRAAASAANAGQFLLEPVLCELTQAQAELLGGRLAELAALGLDVQPFGGSAFLIRTLPHLSGAASTPASLAGMLADAAVDSNDWLDHLRISLACRSALRRGQPLTPHEQQDLLVDLCDAAASAVCPHGSPLMLRYSKAFLTKAFEW
jgi:DNA mismatch repair protein MutL